MLRQVHYFEDGNVRMEAKRGHSASVTGAGSDLADAIAEAIREAEAQVPPPTSLETTRQTLRRKLHIGVSD